MAEVLARANRLLHDACDHVRHHAQRLAPGLLFCGLVVLAASYLAERYGAPALLGALLLGMAFNNVSKHGEFAAGIDVCARPVLRFGVALLGARISVEQIAALGWQPLWLVLAAVVGTLVFSLLMARVLRLDPLMGMVSGAAVAICGASAALAVVAVLQGKGRFRDAAAERHLLCTLVTVTGLSTLAMLSYPALLMHAGLGPEQIGMVLGAAIHDVAQVFGAGHLVSDRVADLATYTKMLRVALLVPLILLITCAVPPADRTGAGRLAAFPLFLVGFAALLLLANLQVLPTGVIAAGSDLSRLCLLLAMVAIGTKTNLWEMRKVGFRPFFLLLLNTLFIAGLALLLVL